MIKSLTKCAQMSYSLKALLHWCVPDGYLGSLNFLFFIFLFFLSLPFCYVASTLFGLAHYLVIFNFLIFGYWWIIWHYLFFQKMLDRVLLVVMSLCYHSWWNCFYFDLGLTSSRFMILLNCDTPSYISDVVPEFKRGRFC